MQLPFSYQIIRTSRKTVAIQIKYDGSVVIRCPRFMKQSDIGKLITEKSEWIQSHIQAFSQGEPLPCYTEEELNDIIQKAKVTIPERTRLIAKQVGISYNRVTIRCQHTRWGSCSSKGNLNFNCLLVLTPLEVMDYVIIHELCHRKEMNHSPSFWKEVEKHQPNYSHSKKWLKEEGSKLIRRLPK